MTDGSFRLCSHPIRPPVMEIVMCRWPKNACYLRPEKLGLKMEVWSYGLAESQKESESKHWGRVGATQQQTVSIIQCSTCFITYSAKLCSQSYYKCSLIIVRYSRGVIDAALYKVVSS